MSCIMIGWGDDDVMLINHCATSYSTANKIRSLIPVDGKRISHRRRGAVVIIL
jgi:hypothetical protein